MNLVQKYKIHFFYAEKNMNSCYLLMNALRKIGLVRPDIVPSCSHGFGFYHNSSIDSVVGYIFQAASVTIYKMPLTFSQRNTFANLTIFVYLQMSILLVIPLDLGKQKNTYLLLVFICRPIIFSLLGVTCFGFKASKGKIPSSSLSAEPDLCPTS